MRKANINNVCPVVQAKINGSSTDSIPVIISFKKNKSKATGQIDILSNKVRYDLPIVNGYACDMSSQAIKELRLNSDIEYICYDARVFALIDIASQTVKCKVPHDLGYQGKGVTIATIDTGVSPHSDLTRPTNRIIGFKDFINEETQPYDDNGHGTHIAGIIASNGISSNGKYKGIAPEANIVAAKVLDDKGSGSTSDIISAVQWIIDTKQDYDTKVLNISLGTPADYFENRDPLVKAANAAINSGITVIAAVGNSGPARRTVLSPATSRYVISVGAIDDNKTPDTSDDFIARFSSRGPTIDGIRKPDLSAPGVDIMSLSHNDSQGYNSLSGTSMAAPIITGAAALLLSANPKYSHFEIKRMLLRSCSKIRASSYDQGAGVLNFEKLFRNR